MVDDTGLVFLLSCGTVKNHPSGLCGTTPFVFTSNIFLGYYHSGSEPPGLFYPDDRSIKVTANHNIEYGYRSGTGETCRDNICSDPRLQNEPPPTGMEEPDVSRQLQLPPNKRQSREGAWHSRNRRTRRLLRECQAKPTFYWSN